MWGVDHACSPDSRRSPRCGRDLREHYTGYPTRSVPVLWYLGCWLLCSQLPVSAALPLLRPIGEFKVKGDVVEDRDLSGIALISSSRGLIGADESTAVQVVGISSDGDDFEMRVLQTIRLLDSKDEIDIEGIGVDGTNYYVVGSHGRARVSGKFEASRLTLFRLPVDRATGRSEIPRDPRTGVPLDIQQTSLRGLLRTDPTLGPYYRQPLQQNGVNIEALAAGNGLLFIGFRAPHHNGTAYVLEIRARDLFAHALNRYRLHSLQLGEGMGIRGMTPIGGEILILAGNAGVEPNSDFPASALWDPDRQPVVYHWSSRKRAPKPLGVLGDPKGKAEAIVVLEERKSSVDIVVLFDGAREGRPTVYRVPLPSQ